MFVHQGGEFREFIENYANWDGLKSVCITFDVDFAPDYMIRNVRSLLDKFEARATFFMTHSTKELLNDNVRSEHELGIHPNLNPGSTQGTNNKEIIDNLLSLDSSIQGNRFHILNYSYRDLMYLGMKGLLYDVSTVRFNCPYLLPVWHNDIKLTLLTYCWEDGVCESTGLAMKLDSIDLKSPGMKIINFHPMNVYINGPDDKARLNFIGAYPDLINCPENQAAAFRCSGDGSGKVLEDLLLFLKMEKIRTLTVAELAAAYKKIFPSGMPV